MTDPVMGRPRGPRDPEVARRLEELLVRTKRTAASLVAPRARALDDPTRRKEMRIRSLLKCEASPPELDELAAIFRDSWIKEPDVTAHYVLTGGKKPAWWSDKTETGILPKAPTQAIAQPLPSGPDPLVRLLQSVADRVTSPKEAASTLEVMIRSGVISFPAPVRRARGAGTSGQRLPEGLIARVPQKRGVLTPFPRVRALRRQA